MFFIILLFIVSNCVLEESTGLKHNSIFHDFIKIVFYPARLVTILLLFVGCAPIVNSIDGYSETIIFDFQPYTERGFYFSHDTYPGEFRNMGSIYKIFNPRAKRGIDSADPIYGNYGRWSVERINSQMILEEIYNDAKSIGADGVTGVNIEVRAINVNSLILPTVIVTGFAIKRK